MKRRSAWITVGIVGAVLCSFAFTESFRHTLSRRRELHRAQQELAALDEQVQSTREQLKRVENDPAAREELVRKELGYLRPGEKEVRFLDHRN